MSINNNKTNKTQKMTIFVDEMNNSMEENVTQYLIKKIATATNTP